VDVLATRNKACSFDCVYCQLGPTAVPVVRRREFVALADLEKELESVRNLPLDHATFSGMGEPTLAANLGEAIDLVHSVLTAPVAVLTNSSLLHREDVREDLARADLVVAKLDGPDEATFRRVDRPRLRCSLEGVVESIRRFRDVYTGRLALQMMFIGANRDRAAEMARLAAGIEPDEVQLCTPLRDCAVDVLSPAEVESIRREFSGIGKVVSAYGRAPETSAVDCEATRRRRPTARLASRPAAGREGR
jgi:wyosine [tRNA(Phe)-imidazoG37] synthetase (radical SAM superfamily)